MFDFFPDRIFIFCWKSFRSNWIESMEWLNILVSLNVVDFLQLFGVCYHRNSMNSQKKQRFNLVENLKHLFSPLFRWIKHTLVITITTNLNGNILRYSFISQKKSFSHAINYVGWICCKLQYNRIIKIWPIKFMNRTQIIKILISERIFAIRKIIWWKSW